MRTRDTTTDRADTRTSDSRVLELLLLPSLHERVTIGLRVLFAGAGLYALAVAALAGPDGLPRLLVHFGRLAGVLGLVVLVRKRPDESTAAMAALLAAAMITWGTGLLNVLRSASDSTLVVSTGLAMITAPLLPWSAGKQAALGVICLLAIFGNNWGLHGEIIAPLDAATIYSAVACVLAAVYVSHYLESSRRALKQRLGIAAKAERELRLLREQLETRVDERTAELKAANHELQNFGFAVSHDLRAPLRTVSGFADLIEEEQRGELPETSLDYLGRIRAGAKRMDGIIDGLLKLGRITRGELNRQPASIPEIAREILRELHEEFPERDVDIRILDAPIIRGDPGLLQLVVENLVRNAWKFTADEKPAVIEVGFDGEGPDPAFYVRDNGVGFEPAHASKLFQPFEQLHTDNRFHGSGIGLATAQRILQRHGGKIWAEAIPDVGATFYFTVAARPTTTHSS